MQTSGRTGRAGTRPPTCDDDNTHARTYARTGKHTRTHDKTERCCVKPELCVCVCVCVCAHVCARVCVCVSLSLSLSPGAEQQVGGAERQQHAEQPVEEPGGAQQGHQHGGPCRGSKVRGGRSKRMRKRTHVLYSTPSMLYCMYIIHNMMNYDDMCSHCSNY